MADRLLSFSHEVHVHAQFYVNSQGHRRDVVRGEAQNTQKFKSYTQKYCEIRATVLSVDTEYLNSQAQSDGRLCAARRQTRSVGSGAARRHVCPVLQCSAPQLATAMATCIKPNSITLAGSKLVRSWFELKSGLSSSLLAANQHELVDSRPNSITLQITNQITVQSTNHLTKKI